MAELSICRRNFGMTCGLKPKIIFWSYLTIVKRMVTYACIWSDGQRNNSCAVQLAWLESKAMFRLQPSGKMYIFSAFNVGLSIWCFKIYQIVYTKLDARFVHKNNRDLIPLKSCPNQHRCQTSTICEYIL